MEKLDLLSDTVSLYAIGAIFVVAVVAIVFMASSKKKEINGDKNGTVKKSDSKEANSSASNPKKKNKNKKQGKNPSAPTQEKKVSTPPTLPVSQPIEAASVLPTPSVVNKPAVIGGAEAASPIAQASPSKKDKKKGGSSPEKKSSSEVVTSAAGTSASVVAVEAAQSAQVFYSKESIENFNVYEELDPIDPNDGWTAVEIQKKNKKASKAVPSEDLAPVSNGGKANGIKDHKAAPVAEAPLSPVEPPVVVEKTPAAPEPVRLPSEPTPVESVQVPQPPAVPEVPKVQKEVKIDPKKVGFIIGPKGATLRSIETATECEIIMPKTERDQTTPATIFVSGSASGTTKAVKAITDLATKGYSALIAGEGFQENSILVPIKSIPDIIGRNGSVIKKIQDLFKVKLNLPDTSNRDPSITKVRISVAGHKEQVAPAKEVIKEITQYFYSSVTHPDSTHQELDVPPEAYSLIIGARGSEIRHIQSNFKVSVHIPNSETFLQKVIIVGNAAAVEKAATYIHKMIAKAEARQEEYVAAKEAAVDEDDENHEEWMDQYKYKRPLASSPKPPVPTEPSSPFMNSPGVVPTVDPAAKTWCNIAAVASDGFTFPSGPV